MRTIMTFLISIMFCSCNTNRQQNKTETNSKKSIDEIEVIYYNHHDDTLIYYENNLEEMNVLIKLMTETNEEAKDTCQPAGKLIYKFSDKSNLELEFSSSKTNEFAECNFVKHKAGNKTIFNSLPKDAEILIDNILWRRLKWSSIRMDTTSLRLDKDTGK